MALSLPQRRQGIIEFRCVTLVSNTPTGVSSPHVEIVRYLPQNYHIGTDLDGMESGIQPVCRNCGPAQCISTPDLRYGDQCDRRKRQPTALVYPTAVPFPAISATVV